MSSNGFWIGVVMASDDARRAKARRNAQKLKAIRRAKRNGISPADLTRTRSSHVVDTLVIVAVLVMAVWLWTWLR